MTTRATALLLAGAVVGHSALGCAAPTGPALPCHISTVSIAAQGRHGTPVTGVRSAAARDCETVGGRADGRWGMRSALNVDVVIRCGSGAGQHVARE
jgi:hypothetical protein